MSCPSDARLAAAVADEDAAAIAHADGCARCATAIAEGRATRRALASLPTPAPVRRADLLAEVLAQAEREVPAPVRGARSPSRGWRFAAAAVVIAAMGSVAAAGVGFVRQRTAAHRSMAVEVLRPAATESQRVRPRTPATRAPAVEPMEPVMQEPVMPEPVPVVTAPVRVPTAMAPRVATSAHRDAPRIDASRIDAPRIDTPSIDSPAVDTPSVDTPPVGVAAFRAGWEALRVGQPLVARAHFDRADDPAVAEDAAYWAAVASERAGQRLEAARRYRGFAQAFPASPRAADARAAAARLYDQ